jgi:hypothetical protein
LKFNPNTVGTICFVATDRPGGITNRNKPLLINLSLGLVLKFNPNTVGTICFVATDRPGGITNRNKPLLIFHVNPTNTIGWARKSSFSL